MMNVYSLWILLSSWLVCTGWILSALHQLQAGGYVLSLIFFTGFFALWVRSGGTCERWIKHGLLFRLRRRFSKPVPLIYLVYLVLDLLGGSLYAPTNYDGLCYRLPRILHWWSQGGWHWIGGENIRMDYSATGFEWLAAPLLILFKTDRLLFLINLISYALLPGLIYSAFTQLGVARRVAWYWMWILPTAYCIILQVGSIGNDMFATVFFLASASFALRAMRRCSWWDAALSVLAAALLTGAKASNLPLLLPLAYVMWGLVPIIVKKPWRSLVLVLVVCVVSFLPIAIMNLRYTRDWTGDPGNTERMKLFNPVAGLAGNALQLSISAVVPPVFPFAKAWNSVADKILHKHPLQGLQKDYPRLSLSVGELATEEGAGLGLGLLLLCAAGIVFSIFHRFAGGFSRPAMIFGLLTWVALAAFMAKMGSESAARLASPYYAGIMVPLLALRTQALIVAAWWWRVLACMSAFSVLPALLINPARPLIPPSFLIASALALHVPESMITRIRSVYTVYGSRSDSLAELRGHLPVGSTRIGFAGTGNESEYSLWKPLGETRVQDAGSNGVFSHAAGELDCIVGSQDGIFSRFGLPAEEYAHSIGGKVIWKEYFAIMAGKTPREWYIITPFNERGFHGTK